MRVTAWGAVAGREGAIVVVAVFVAGVVNLSLFGTLAAWAVITARRETSPRIRPLLWALATVAGAFVLSALTRLLLVGTRLDVFPGDVEALLGSEWVLVQTLVATLLGVAGVTVLRHVGGSLARADRVVTTLSERLVDSVSLDELGLTPREQEVVALIGEGVVSDRAIAEALVISPATAGTHVRNVLRKAGLTSRRELALFALSDDR